MSVTLYIIGEFLTCLSIPRREGDYAHKSGNRGTRLVDREIRTILRIYAQTLSFGHAFSFSAEPCRFFLNFFIRSIETVLCIYCTSLIL